MLRYTCIIKYRYPVGTMFFQSFASMIVSLECIIRFTPDIYCDTIGAAFSYPVVKLLTNATILAYVHYPTISTDMMNKVREQRPSYNNTNVITKSITISYIKLCYYKIFAMLYTWAGSYAQLVMVNSTWTMNHIKQLWFTKQYTTGIITIL